MTPARRDQVHEERETEAAPAAPATPPPPRLDRGVVGVGAVLAAVGLAVSILGGVAWNSLKDEAKAAREETARQWQSTAEAIRGLTSAVQGIRDDLARETTKRAVLEERVEALRRRDK